MNTLSWFDENCAHHARDGVRGAIIRHRTGITQGKHNAHASVCQGNWTIGICRLNAIGYSTSLKRMYRETAFECHNSSGFYANTWRRVGQPRDFNRYRGHCRQVVRRRLRTTIDERYASAAAARAARAGAGTAA